VEDRRSSEKNGLFVFICSSVGEQTGGKNLADLLSLWQPVFKLFSPGSRPDKTKIGVGMPEMNQKDDPAPGIKFICGLGQQVIRFLHNEHHIVKSRSF
jgi:hypothetical protein